MERARACLVLGAVAAVIGAAAVGSVPTASRDIAADGVLAAARVIVPVATARPAPADPSDEEHGAASQDPIVVGDPHDGMGGTPSMQPMPSPDPTRGMDMGVHGATAGPGGSPAPSDDRHDDASAKPGHGEAPADDHGDGPADEHGEAPADDHGDEAAAGSRPRELVLGGFGLLNALAFAGAAILRRRDRAAAARKAAHRAGTSPNRSSEAPR